MKQLIDEIVRAFDQIKDRRITGEKAVRWMKDNDSHDWRQVEWVGYSVEDYIRNTGFNRVNGPYDADSFCEKLNLPIECKTHCSTSSTDDILLNSKRNTDSIMNQYGKELVIVMNCDAELDEDGSFRKWHNEFKGGKVTNYTGKYSRKRKSAVTPRSISAFFLDNDVLNRCSSMTRNGNPKYKIKLKDIPEESYILKDGVYLDK